MADINDLPDAPVAGVTTGHADDHADIHDFLEGRKSPTGNLAMGTRKITGLGDPTLAQDAATRAYVLANSETDHGGLTGLADDDHTQYLTEARHDALAADNPHSVTLTQAVTADAGTNATAAEIEELTDGSTTALHGHSATSDHGALTGLADDDHTQYHTAARHASVDHTGFTGIGSDGSDHTIASHSDTTATGAELEELTDGSTTTLHGHAGIDNDHGTLTGLADDDHTQYLTTARHTALDHADLDTDAIHIDIAAELVGITEKTSLSNDDLFIIEDSASANTKKRVKFSNVRGSGTIPSSGAKGHLLVGDGASGWLSKPFWHPEMHLCAMSSYGGLTAAGGATGQPGFPYSDPVEAYGDLQWRSTGVYGHRWGSLVFMPGTYDIEWTSGISDANAIIPAGANFDMRAFHTSGGYGQGDSTQPKVHIRRADISANDGLPLVGYPVGFDTANEWHAWITFQGINFVGLNGRNASFFSTKGTTATNTTTAAPLFRWWNAGANMIYRDCAFNDNNGYWVHVETSIENLWFDNVFSNVTLGAIQIDGWSTGGVLLFDKVQIDNFQRMAWINNLNAPSNLRVLAITNSSFEGSTGSADGDYEHIVYRTTNGTSVATPTSRVMSVAIRDCVMFQQDSGNTAWEATYEEVDSGDGSSWPLRVYIDNSPFRDDVYTGSAYKSALSGFTSTGRGDDLFFDGSALWETHNGAKYKNNTSYA